MQRIFGDNKFVFGLFCTAPIEQGCDGFHGSSQFLDDDFGCTHEDDVDNGEDESDPWDPSEKASLSRSIAIRVLWL